MLRFRSKAGADVLMLAAHGDAVLRALGREPAPQGIFLPEQVPEALASLARAEQLGSPPEDETQEPVFVPQLRQRAWPLRELLQRAAHQAEPVVWETV